LKAFQVGVGLEKGFLHGVFGIFTVPRDIHRQPKYLVLVAVDKLFEGSSVT
jgi:hypothetical protein